ncbi:MAG: hypothetical protein M3P53_02500 [Actinomycetota bacterium]|nr:hypothetical protein [Actinomycetota bacterium]
MTVEPSNSTSRSRDACPLHRCRLYRPGHDVHWIQVRKSCEWAAEHPRRLGQLVSVDGDGWISVAFPDGSDVRLWHHDSPQLTALAADNSGNVWYQERASLLGTGSTGGDQLFCVATTKDGSSPCSEEHASSYADEQK